MALTLSEEFYQRTGNKKQFLYNIQPMENIPSVIQNGILSHDLAKKINHRNISMDEVQDIRENLRIPNGSSLHSYANVYFDARNPMMYKRQELAESLCVLAISPQILDIQGTVVSDGNAASQYTRFYTANDGIGQLRFDIIYSKWWTDMDIVAQFNKKRIKCAEVLVPDRIPYDYILEAIVVNRDAYVELQVKGFNKPIRIIPDEFFH